MFIRTETREMGDGLVVCSLYENGKHDGQIVRYMNAQFETEATYILVNGDVVRKATGRVSDKKTHNCIMRLLRQAK